MYVALLLVSVICAGIEAVRAQSLLAASVGAFAGAFLVKAL